MESSYVFQLGKLKSKYLILDCFSYSDRSDAVFKHLYTSCHTLRKLLIQNFNLAIDIISGDPLRIFLVEPGYGGHAFFLDDAMISRLSSVMLSKMIQRYSLTARCHDETNLKHLLTFKEEEKRRAKIETLIFNSNIVENIDTARIGMRKLHINVISEVDLAQVVPTCVKVLKIE